MCTVKHCAALFVHAEILVGAKALEMSQLRKAFGDNLSFRQPAKKSQAELALKEGFNMDSISPTEPNCRDSGHG